ncbi:MAG TPA: hypothetical protein VMY34_01945 [Acidimicrobiales bacterium]|nr:hypothetical protein [Acidimicrobiales bacterium]
MLHITPAADLARPPLVRGLWAVTAVMLLASTIVLITGAAGEESRDHTPAPISSAAGGGGESGPNATSSGAEASVPNGAPGASVPTTASPSSKGKTGGSKAPPASPFVPAARLNGEPSAGTYRYHLQTKSGDDPAEDSDGTTRVEAISADAAGTRQNVTIDGPNGSTRMQTLWQGGTVRVVEQSYKFGSYDATCRWQPELLLRRAGLKAGDQWRGESTCEISVGTNSFTLKIVEDAKVAKQETIAVGGRELKVFVIDRTSTQTADKIAFKGTTRTTERFAPDVGLVARAHAEGSYTAFGRSGSYTTDQVLLDSQPS